MKHTLEVDSVQLSYGDRKILSDVYLKCETGKVTALLGRNGEGKTSLLRATFGTLDAEKSVRFDKRAVQRAFKQPGLIRYLPQFHFVPSFKRLGGVFRDYDVSLAEFKNCFELRLGSGESFGNLSGGERRLVEVFIVIKSKCQFALLDEPFTHLSPLQIDTVKSLISDEKTNKGFMIIDHLYEHVLGMADDVYLLTDGRVRKTSGARDLEEHGYINWSG